MNQENINLIKAACDNEGMHYAPIVAYVLATVEHETAGTYDPVREAFYLGERDGRAEAYRKSLRYYPYYGRGFVQLTWEENYQKFSDMLGKDLVAHPDMVMDPQLAATILVTGMRHGMFTGRNIRQYVNESGSKDYIGARMVINGTDRAFHIRDLAVEWEKRLTDGAQ